MLCAPILAHISEGAAWSILLRIWSRGSPLGQFIPQGTLGIAWKDYGVSQLGEREGGTGTWWVKTRDAAQPAAMPRTPPQQRPSGSQMSVVLKLRDHVTGGKNTHQSGAQLYPDSTEELRRGYTTAARAHLAIQRWDPERHFSLQWLIWRLAP